MLEPDWYRDEMEPFRLGSRRDTFFFAWAPEDYPDEVGYCWRTNSPKPAINDATGLIDISFSIEGIAL